MRQIGPYQVIRELGRGGMGVVYEVEDVRLPGRRLALKQNLSDEPDTVARFLREAELLARVRHPNVVGVVALDHTPQGPYLVTDLVQGTELSVRRGQPLNPQEAARLVRELASAVAAVHAQGVLHRDLKPDNVIVRPDGSPVLLDFGVAREVGGERLTQTGAAVGTIQYMSPEQAGGEPTSQLTARTDVYALGAVLFFLLTGEPPFPGGGISTIQKVLMVDPPWPDPGEAGADLVAILRKAMAKERIARYPSAEALQADLDRFLAGEQVEAKLPSSGGRRALAIGGALLAVVGLGAAFAATRPGPTPETTESPSAEPSPTATRTPTPEPSAPAIAHLDHVRMIQPKTDPMSTLSLGVCFLDDRTLLVFSGPPASPELAKKRQLQARLWRVDLTVSPAGLRPISLPAAQHFVYRAVPDGAGGAYLALGDGVHHLSGTTVRRVSPTLKTGIWAMARAPDGRLAVGVGPQWVDTRHGKQPIPVEQPLFTLDPTAAEPVWTPRPIPGGLRRQLVRSMAYRPDGTLLVGTAPPPMTGGRVEMEKGGKVLVFGDPYRVFDPIPGEILSLATGPGGSDEILISTSASQIRLLNRAGSGPLGDLLPYVGKTNLARSVSGAARGLVRLGSTVVGIGGDFKPGTNDLRRWDWTGKRFEAVGAVTRFRLFLSSIAASPNGELVALGSHRSRIFPDALRIEVWPVAMLRNNRRRSELKGRELP